MGASALASCEVSLTLTPLPFSIVIRYNGLSGRPSAVSNSYVLRAPGIVNRQDATEDRDLTGT